MFLVTLKTCLIVLFCGFTAEAYAFDNIKTCTNTFFANRKYESPVNINLRDLVPLLMPQANLILDPDTYEKVPVEPRKIEENGILHIIPYDPPKKKSTLKMSFLRSDYELRDIHLFWGKTTMTDQKKVIPLAEGSEHSISGKFFPIEVRLVYAPTNTTTNHLGLYFRAVVKVHFLTVEIDKPMGRNEAADDDVFLNEIIPPAATSLKEADYAGYRGALTTGTLTRNVLWVISLKTAAIKQDTFQKLYNAYKDLEKRKRAPIRPLCGRYIYKLT